MTLGLLLGVVTVLVTVSMVGVEAGVAVLINPPLARLEPPVRGAVQPVLAGRMGAAMPVWYIAGTLLLVAEALVRHEGVLWAAVALWGVALLFSVTLLVPLNARIAKAAQTGPYPGMAEEQRTWDRRHRWRVLMLVGAVLCLLAGLLRS